MTKPRSTGTVVIVAVMLMLPVLYVASYFALVGPCCEFETVHYGLGYWKHYRTASESCENLFWPLEQIDRRVRPKAWDAPNPNANGS